MQLKCIIVVIIIIVIIVFCEVIDWVQQLVALIACYSFFK